MLLRTLFVLLFFTALAETFVHGAHALAQAALRRQALVADRAEAATAVSLARDAVASAIASGHDPRDPQPVAPSPAPACVLASQTGCAMIATATIAFSTPPANATPTPCPSDDCTIYEQGNDAVGEGRVDAAILTQVLGADGAVLATRSWRAAFRTWRLAPYAALAGELDESVAAIAGAGPGDDGGAAPIGTAPGTLIDVLYENRVSGATMPANVWQSQVQRSVTAPPAWSP